jgi:L-seryl-tRNA(Ser) seleniumtransferase
MTKLNFFRYLPSVDEVLQRVEVLEEIKKYPRAIVVDSIREAINSVRDEIKKGFTGAAIEDAQEDTNEAMVEKKLSTLILKLFMANVNEKGQQQFRPVINGTGTVLHTNLGRSLLSAKAQEAINQVAGAYSNLELDLATGLRGSRYDHITDVLTKLTGAESALVVNNNAGAVLLALATLAKGKEVIVSRGQLVEIGGSFRIPEVMEQSGAKLVEVGATNKTHPRDYSSAVTDETALLLKVHTSNYRVVGFTRETTSEELVEIGKQNNLPVMEDLGSGFLVNLRELGVGDEPTVQECVASGIDVVTFSGDKLLGGPQAGIIVGKRKYIDLIKKHPLTRALRVDKLTLAALEATLRAYLEPETVLKEVPTLRLLTTKLEDLDRRADSLIKKIQDKLALISSENNRPKITIEKIQGFSQVGGGALPTTDLETKLVALSIEAISLREFSVKLRKARPALLVRIQENKILMDPRTILDEQLDQVAEIIKGAISED